MVSRTFLHQDQLFEIYEEEGAWVRHTLGWSLTQSKPADPDEEPKIFAVEMVGKRSSVAGRQVLSEPRASVLLTSGAWSCPVCFTQHKADAEVNPLPHTHTWHLGVCVRGITR